MIRNNKSIYSFLIRSISLSLKLFHIFWLINLLIYHLLLIWINSSFIINYHIFRISIILLSFIIHSFCSNLHLVILMPCNFWYKIWLLNFSIKSLNPPDLTISFGLNLCHTSQKFRCSTWGWRWRRRRFAFYLYFKTIFALKSPYACHRRHSCE